MPLKVLAQFQSSKQMQNTLKTVQVIVLLAVTAVCSFLLGMSCVGCAWCLSTSRHRAKKAGVFPGHVFFSPYGDCYHLKDDCRTLRNRPMVKNILHVLLGQGHFRGPASKHPTANALSAEASSFEPKGGVDSQRFVGSQFE